ncbi:hypothetical protein ANN_09137 [Periplaneta americana]|uniref:Tc1-like transposase DDE domain-containing protein n=1 Tax=Periplaneta americana TaxID=6978 RepID=A0ABQ8TMK4_PERAM|nr:hypothetical protein ANN_09137 [Periplaneta americana]
MNPGSNTESYPAFAHIGLRENPGKNLNQVTCPDQESNPGHLVSRLDSLTLLHSKTKHKMGRKDVNHFSLLRNMRIKAKIGGKRLFSDESKFNVFGSDGRQMVWRKPKEEMEIKNLRATVKHSRGNVMLWECMSASGVGELVFIEDIMKKEDYLHLLQHNLVKSAEKLGIEKEFMFYQNNDPKHNSYIVQECLLYKCPKVLHPLPQSPDLNPIEHLWEERDRRIGSRPISSKEELKARLQEEWVKIPIDISKKLVHSMPPRLKEVIKQKGGPTRFPLNYDSGDEDCKDSNRAQLQATAKLETELPDIAQPYEEGAPILEKIQILSAMKLRIPHHRHVA